MVQYREIQRPPRFLWWVLILPLFILGWYGFIQQIILGIPFGSKPAPDTAIIILWIVLGGFLPVMIFWFFKLIIEVRDDGLYIRFMPFHINYKQFLFKEIEHYEPVVYSPLLQFGGWGIRYNLNGEMAYSMYGKQALELKTKKMTLVIGTQKPDELKEALDSSVKEQQ